MNSVSIVLFAIILTSAVSEIRVDDICTDGLIDSITELVNGSLVIFRKNNVWILNRSQKQLIGPMPIAKVLKGINDAVESAVTFTEHETIVEFEGSSIYFTKGKFYTFRNFGPYQVEWGSLIYLPHEGSQDSIGSANATIASIMKNPMAYAYFDPIDKKSHFVFPDKKVLAFNFDMGTEFDRPSLSTIDEVFSKYGLTSIPPTVNAAFTEKVNNLYHICLFNGPQFCAFNVSNPPPKTQTCEWKETKSSFLPCNEYLAKSGEASNGNMNAKTGESIKTFYSGNETASNGISSNGTSRKEEPKPDQPKKNTSISQILSSDKSFSILYIFLSVIICIQY